MDPSLDENIKKAFSKLLKDDADVLTTSDDDLKCPTNLMKKHTNTGNHKHIALKPYRLPLAHIKWLDECIDKLLKAGIIRHSTSPWNSPVVLVSKEEGGLRLCIELRHLNSVAIKYKYPISFTEEMLLCLGNLNISLH